MFEKRKNVIANPVRQNVIASPVRAWQSITSIILLAFLAGCTDYAQEFRDEYGPGGNGSSEEISELDYDCSVSEGVKVLYPAQQGDRDFTFGDTITVVYGTDVRGSGYRFVFLDEGENQVDLLDKTVGPTAPDGRTCYTQKVVFDNEFFLEGVAGYIGVVPVEYPFLAGTSGLFKVYPRRSENESDDEEQDFMTDSRDGKEYRTLKTDSHIWMAENLNYAEDGSCFVDQQEYCDEYGHLYTWKKASSVCPDGWSLPTTDIVEELLSYVGGKSIAAQKLKSSEVWLNGVGDDAIGFTALPAGVRFDGEYSGVEERTAFWTSTEYDATHAYGLNLLGDDARAYLDINDKNSSYSVRCVKKISGSNKISNCQYCVWTKKNPDPVCSQDKSYIESLIQQSETDGTYVGESGGCSD